MESRPKYAAPRRTKTKAPGMECQVLVHSAGGGFRNPRLTGER